MKPNLEIRRRLLTMTTQDTLQFGVLTVRLFKSRATVRWQIDSAEIRQAYRYPRYADIDTINDVLAQATAYILINRDGRPRRLCLNCNQPVHRSPRAKYCSASCAAVDADRRYRAKRRVS
jgi:hypothetical protein